MPAAAALHSRLGAEAFRAARPDPVSACVLQLLGSLGSSAGRAPEPAQYQITVVTAWYSLAGAGSAVPTRLLGHGLGAEHGAAVAPEGRGDGVAAGEKCPGKHGQLAATQCPCTDTQP